MQHLTTDIDIKCHHSLSVTNVSYSVAASTNYNSNQKVLLNQINMSLVSGQLCAIMGASGSGKTTLLDIIANRKLSGRWSGDILIDNKPRSGLFNRYSAYVLQNSIHLTNFTVEETLHYAVWTRMEGQPSKIDRQARVDYLIDIMALSEIRHTEVGDVLNKKLSGGELKRLSIAVEIAGLPFLLLLDEPTSGLDSANAFNIMKIMRQLTVHNRIVITTIHQPSAEIFQLFHKIVLLSQGRIIYFGDTDKVVDYFSSPVIGYELDEAIFNTHAEFVISIASKKIPSKTRIQNGQPTWTIPQLDQLFRSSAFFQQTAEKTNNVLLYSNLSLSSRNYVDSLHSSDTESSYSSTSLCQFQMLMHRGWIGIVRDKNNIQAQFVKNICIGVLVGLVFYNQGNVSYPLFINNIPVASVNNSNAGLFFGMTYCLMSNIQSITVLCSNVTVFRRELASYAYSTGPLWLSQSLIYLPVVFVNHILFLGLNLPLFGFPSSVLPYGFFMLFLANWLSFYYAQFLAVSTESSRLALAIFPMSFILFTSFSGFPVVISNIPAFLSWGAYVSFTRWIFEGLICSLWSRFESEPSLAEGGSGNGYDVLGIYGFEDCNSNDAIWIVFLYIIGILFISYFCMLPYHSHLRYVPESDVLDIDIRNNADANENENDHLDDILIDELTLKRGLIPLSHQEPEYKGVKSADEMESAQWYNFTGSPSNSSAIDAAGGFISDYFSRDTVGLDGSPNQFHSGLRLTLIDVSYSVLSTGNVKTQKKQKKEILNGISCRIVPGELCAVMGSSGCGKTSLLDVIAGRKGPQGSILSGEILLNGVTRKYNSHSQSRNFAYVVQNYLHIDVLTVKETLMYAAHLRLNQNVSHDLKIGIVESLLELLGLKEVANSIVGSDTLRGISGGEFKRLSIGVELVHKPQLIIMDEPTTGLDSSSAYSVMTCVRTLADNDRTVICTIHQPSIPCYSLFDKLILLAKGRLVYFGPASKVVNYFNSCSLHLDTVSNVDINFNNPADCAVAIAGGSLGSKTVEELEAMFISSEQHRWFDESILAWIEADKSLERTFFFELKSDSGSTPEYPTSFLYQTRTLCHRAAVRMLKAPNFTLLVLFRHVFVGLFYGSLYFGLDGGTDTRAYLNRLSLLFFLLMFLVIGQQQAIPVLFENRPLYYQEAKAGLYGATSYWISTWILEIPVCVICAILCVSTTYKMADLNKDPNHFAFCLFLTSLCASTGVYFAQLMASVSSSANIAISLYPIALFFTITFAGFMLYLPSIPVYLAVWGPNISFLRYAYQALVLNELENNAYLSSEMTQTYISNLGFDGYDKWFCLIILFVFTICFAIGSLGALKYINYGNI